MSVTLVSFHHCYGAFDQIFVLRSAVTTVYSVVVMAGAVKYLDLSDVSKVAIASLQLGAVLVVPSISPTSSAFSAPVSVTSSSLLWSLQLPEIATKVRAPVVYAALSLQCFCYLSICRSASCCRSPVLLLLQRPVQCLLFIPRSRIQLLL